MTSSGARLVIEPQIASTLFVPPMRIIGFEPRSDRGQGRMKPARPPADDQPSHLLGECTPGQRKGAIARRRQPERGRSIGDRRADFDHCIGFVVHAPLTNCLRHDRQRNQQIGRGDYQVIASRR